MALRDGGRAELRRAARGSSRFAVLAVALYAAAAVAWTWPAVTHPHRFLSGGAPARGEVSPGDYLQTAYRLWLPGHQLEHGRAPWVDPYSFRPESAPRPNPGG